MVAVADIMRTKCSSSPAIEHLFRAVLTWSKVFRSQESRVHSLDSSMFVVLLSRSLWGKVLLCSCPVYTPSSSLFLRLSTLYLASFVCLISLLLFVPVHPTFTTRFSRPFYFFLRISAFIDTHRASLVFFYHLHSSLLSYSYYCMQSTKVYYLLALTPVIKEQISVPA